MPHVCQIYVARAVSLHLQTRRRRPPYNLSCCRAFKSEIGTLFQQCSQFVLTARCPASRSAVVRHVLPQTLISMVSQLSTMPHRVYFSSVRKQLGGGQRPLIVLQKSMKEALKEFN